MKTVFLNAGTAKNDWVLVDATDKTLGRLATRIAMVLRGKHKPEYTPHVDTGDYIVVVNVDKLRVTGNKAQAKKYFSHTGFPGGINETNFTKLQQRFPELAFHHPRARLGARLQGIGLVRRRRRGFASDWLDRTAGRGDHGLHTASHPVQCVCRS